ncbi:hypothetical protein Tco_0236670 [Tanacetum coccineum]
MVIPCIDIRSSHAFRRTLDVSALSDLFLRMTSSVFSPALCLMLWSLTIGSMMLFFCWRFIFKNASLAGHITASITMEEVVKHTRAFHNFIIVLVRRIPHGLTADIVVHRRRATLTGRSNISGTLVNPMHYMREAVLGEAADGRCWPDEEIGHNSSDGQETAKEVLGRGRGRRCGDGPERRQTGGEDPAG